jgi:ribosomal protein L29
MKMKELQAMGQEELVKKLSMLREQVRDLSFRVHSKEVKSHQELKTVKKDIARVLTLINGPTRESGK